MKAMPSLRRFFVFTLCLAVLSALPACATLKKALPARKPKEKATATPRVPQAIGTVVLVNDLDQFVLIDTGSAPSPPVGMALKTFTGTVESGVVVVGNVQRRPFVVADIVKGTPLKTDTVFQ